MWRGQVYRVSGYDDGTSSDEELPPGRCSVSWIGDNLHQTPGLRMKESSLQLIDRPFVIGDRVSAVKDPQSLGLVVDVRCNCRFSNNPPPSRPYPEVSADRVHPVGGFRMEEVVAHEETRYVGRVVDALFRVEVEIMKRCEGRKGKSKLLGKCAFQVSSEGLSGLTPLDEAADACAQELCPHFPGQQVRATPRVWRQAEWLEDCSQLKKRARGPPICGEVTSVSCEMVGVHWADAWAPKDPKMTMPAEWVHPSSIRRLSMSNSPSEGWLLGEHCQASENPSSPCAVLTRTTTHTTVKWAGGLEEDILSVDLMPRQAFYSHDFLPHDFVARTADVDRLVPPRVETLQTPSPNFTIQDGSVQYGSTQTETNEENRELFATFLGEVNNEEIIPAPPPAGRQVPMGVVKSVDLKARTALVEWRCSLQENPQEVSLFELAPHPLVDVRLADIVFIPPDQQSQDKGNWVGRVTAFSGFSAQVQLVCGRSEWFDVESLSIADMEGHYDSSVSSDEEPEVIWVKGGPDADEPSQAPCGSRDASPSREAEREEVCEHCEQSQSETSEGSSSSTRAPEILAFDVLQEDLSPRDHKFVDRPSPAPKVLMRAVRREHSVLQKGLLDGGEGVVAPIMVRTYSSRCDLFRAMVVGPPGTPYSDVPFFFDLSLSPQYPSEPPLVYFMANYVNSCEKLNPNLYNDGKVCLSILGTWAGPGWDPQKSTLLQAELPCQLEKFQKCKKGVWGLSTHSSSACWSFVTP
ncbi:UBC23 [Symbiodinium sp. CCMP2592]|nr:UBC23 [Symbiodinium sp. CCMP2592]